MAYTPKMFGQDAEKEQEQLGMGGMPALGGTGMGNSMGLNGIRGPGTPQAKEAPQAPQPQASTSSSLGPGTGFVNLDRILGANQGIGGAVTKAGNQAIKTENNAFTGALGSAETAAGLGSKSKGGGIPTSSNPMQPGKGWAWDAGLSSTPIKTAAPNVNALLGGTASPSDLAAITAALGAAPTGNASFNYQPGSGMKQASALANAASTGKQLATNAQGYAGGLAAYNPQMSALDRALYGQEGSAVAARDALKGQVKKTKADEKAATADYATRYASNADRINSSVQALRDQLLSGAKGITNNALSQAQVASPGAGVKLGAENFISPEQEQTLAYISKALGDPSLAMTRTPRDYVAELRARNAAHPEQAAPAQDNYSPRNPTDQEIQDARDAVNKFSQSLGVGGFLAGPLASTAMGPMWQAGQKQLQDRLNQLLSNRAEAEQGGIPFMDQRLMPK